MQLLTTTLTVFEGGISEYIEVSSFLPPRLYCEPLDRDRDCRVSVTTQLLRTDKEVQCPGESGALSQLVFYTDSDLSDDTPCTYSLTMNNWQSAFRIPLSGTVDGLKDRNQKRVVKVTATISASGLEYQPLILGEVQVEVKDRDKRATCSAVGDPHITSFDGK